MLLLVLLVLLLIIITMASLFTTNFTVLLAVTLPACAMTTVSHGTCGRLSDDGRLEC